MRKEKKEKKNRDKWIALRATEEDIAILKKLSKKLKIGVSATVRKLIRSAVVK